MSYEPWMLAAMEEYGYTDTKEGEINRVARYLASQPENTIGNDEFVRACNACGVSASDFDHDDIERIQKKLNSL